MENSIASSVANQLELYTHLKVSSCSDMVIITSENDTTLSYFKEARHTPPGGHTYPIGYVPPTLHIKGYPYSGSYLEQLGVGRIVETLLRTFKEIFIVIHNGEVLIYY